MCFYLYFLITDLRGRNNYCRCTFIHHQIWKIHSGDTCQSSSQLHALESCSRLNEILDRQGQKNITEIFAKTHRKVGRNTKVQYFIMIIGYFYTFLGGVCFAYEVLQMAKLSFQSFASCQLLCRVYLQDAKDQVGR